VTDDLREELVRLRRRDWLATVPVGVALLVSAVVAAACGDVSWVVWATVLVLGTWLCRTAAKAAHKRDAAVLALDDDAVRAYARGRFDGLIARYARVGAAFVAVPFVLLGSVLVLPPHDRPDLLSFGTAFLSLGGVLLVLTLWRRFVARPALIRRRAAIGDGSAAPAPWAVKMARKISAAQGDGFAALFWHEATGVKMKEAHVAVRNLPDAAAPPSAVADSPSAAAPGPSADEMRVVIRSLRRRVLGAHATYVAGVAALFLLENWAKGGSWRSVARDTWSQLTIAQQAYACVGGFFLLGAFAQWTVHRQALAGNAASMRAYWRRVLARRLAHLSGWSAVRIVWTCVAAALAANAVYRFVADGGSARGGGVSPRLVEAALLCAWLLARLFGPRTKARSRAERALADFDAKCAAPSVPPPVA
jgi:hypothetical protein